MIKRLAVPFSRNILRLRNGVSCQTTRRLSCLRLRTLFVLGNSACMHHGACAFVHDAPQGVVA